MGHLLKELTVYLILETKTNIYEAAREKHRAHLLLCQTVYHGCFWNKATEDWVTQRRCQGEDAGLGWM